MKPCENTVEKFNFALHTRLMKTTIAPSILAADFANLQRDIEMINQSDADWFHIDIMDGVFVPNISFGMPVLESIKKHATKTLDVHLMIIEPERYIEKFVALGANILTVHYEACPQLATTLHTIKNFGIKAGVAINPDTDVRVLETLINEIDLVCIMSVYPGFGGQKFIESTYSKIKELKEIISSKKASTLIEIDGGVSSINAPKLIDCGANILVAGSFIFQSENPTETIAKLKNSTSFEIN
jgi:ribulose-phosphate 3-epimerase